MKPVTGARRKQTSARRWRILFIAPSDTGLDVATEIDSLRRQGLEVVSLEGVVTAKRIFDYVNDPNTGCFDIVHFVCHTIENNQQQFIVLTGSETLSAGAVMQIARQTGALLIYLNSCSTAVIGQLLIDNHIPSSIVTIGELKDGMAWQTAGTFYRMLIRTGDLRSAYVASRPAADGKYLWLSNGTYAEEMAQPVLKKLEVIQAALADSLTDRNDLHRQNTKMQRTLYLIGAAVVANLIWLAIHVFPQVVR